jgi:hypothetical protein
METPSDPQSPARATPSRRLRAVDWIALGSLALTVAWTIFVDAAWANGGFGFISFDVLGAISNGIWFPAICGPIAGIAALAESKGRPKWPGIMALLSPLVAGFGSLVAFAIVWGGNT